MKVKLVRVLQEMDNNRSTEILATYYKTVELLIDPQWRMGIQVGNVKFFIDHIIQNIDLGIIILYEFKNIHYRNNYNLDGFMKEREILLKDKWKLEIRKE